MEQKNKISLNRSLYWTSGLYALTAFHHYYGSVVYRTPWRAHVVFIGGAALLLCILFAILYRHNMARWQLYSYLLIALVMFGGGIGLFEGFYNHIIKNVLYFSGMDRGSWRTLFPAPAYELPENAVFEGTGMLQFGVAVPQILSLLKLYHQSFKKTAHVSSA